MAVSSGSMSGLTTLNFDHANASYTAFSLKNFSMRLTVNQASVIEDWQIVTKALEHLITPSQCLNIPMNERCPLLAKIDDDFLRAIKDYQNKFTLAEVKDKNHLTQFDQNRGYAERFSAWFWGFFGYPDEKSEQEASTHRYAAFIVINDREIERKKGILKNLQAYADVLYTEIEQMKVQNCIHDGGLSIKYLHQIEAIRRICCPKDEIKIGSDEQKIGIDLYLECLRNEGLLDDIILSEQLN